MSESRTDRPAPAQRLLVIAHGRSGSAGDPVFGELAPLVPGAALAPIHGRIQRWASGPEPACRQTAALLGGQPGERAEIIAGLAGPDLGRWTGSTVSSVAAADPEGLRSWLSEPTAAPHGGESLVRAAARVIAALDDIPWSDGRAAVVVTPAVARLLAVSAVGGPAELSFRLDVRFGGRFELSRAGRSWRLLIG